MNINDLLGRVIGGDMLGRVVGAGSQMLNTPGKKAAAGGIAASILFTEAGRDLAGAAVKYGGLAALGTLAYQAWQRSQQAGEAPANPVTPPAQISAPAQSDPATENRARLLLGAMINAAKADGHVDAEEQATILNKADALKLSPEERNFLFQEFSKPFDMEPYVQAATTPEIAAEVYAASAIGVGNASPAESSYLHLLANRLSLPQSFVQEVQTALAAPKG